MNDEKTLKLYKGFCDYIIKNTGLRENNHIDATVLRKELKECLKRDKPLGSWWQTFAYDLFARSNIKDERIKKPEPIETVSFKHKGKEYNVNVGYIHFGISKFPESSTLTQNVMREDEREYIKKTLKRFIDRYDDVNTSRVDIHRDYFLIFRESDKQ